MPASKQAPSESARRHQGRPAVALAVVAALASPFAAACSSRDLVVVKTCADAGEQPCGQAPDSLHDGLVGLWHFDETEGSGFAADSSGNGNDGRLVELDPASAWVTGHARGALQVEGAGYATVPLSASIASITSAVTVAAWISLEGTVSDYGTAISRQIGTGIDQYYHLSVNGKDLPTLWIITTVPNKNIIVISAPDPVSRGTFTHIAGTYDGVVARLFVDGSLVASTEVTGSFPSDSTPLILGGNGNNDTVSERFPGRLDEVALYNRALGPDEIARLVAGATESFDGGAGAKSDAGARDQ
jgi:hypothetical protein